MMTVMNTSGSKSSPLVASRQGGALLIVDETFRARLSLPETDAVGGQTVALRVECGIRACDAEADRQMLAETLLPSGDTLLLSSVEQHLATALTQAVKKPLSEADAAALVENASSIEPVVQKALDGAAFGCGMEIVPPISVVATSPSIERQKKLDAVKARQEEVAKLQQAAFGRATDLAKQVESLKASGAKLSAVLAASSGVDRGEILRAAFLTCADSNATLRIAAGSFLVTVDATKPFAEPKSLSVASLGAIRSLRNATLDGVPSLLVGTRGGVCAVDLNAGNVSAQYPLTGISSEFGFNAACVLPESRQVVATHAQLGAVTWNLDTPGEEPTSQSPGTAEYAGGRAVVAIDGRRAAFAAGGTVCILDEHGNVRPVAGSDGATILALVPWDELRLLAVREDGFIDVLDASTLDRLDRIRRGTRPTSASTIECLGANRLLLAGDEGPVIMCGIDDEAITQLGSTISGWRDVAAHNGRIAAVTSDRQRVVIWNAWEPSKPFAEVHVSATVRHRVADVTFG
jgi:hypothetical protein